MFLFSPILITKQYASFVDRAIEAGGNAAEMQPRREGAEVEFLISVAWIYGGKDPLG